MRQKYLGKKYQALCENYPDITQWTNVREYRKDIPGKKVQVVGKISSAKMWHSAVKSCYGVGHVK